MSKLIMRDGFIVMLLVGNNYEKMSDMMRIRNSRSFQGHWRSNHGRLNFQMFCIFARERERERERERALVALMKSLPASYRKMILQRK